MTAKIYFILFLLFSWTALFANDKDNERYIEEYQYIAISEMERTGIPASIKLAQGILESAAGKSTLARKAKNHFGIKCGSKWKGKKHYRKDDDYKRGKLVKSCFRVYKSTENSYLSHSDFLLENKRYSPLFKLDPMNYKKWAKGLKKAGYATSKTYDKKLIRLIEKHKMYRYDQMASSDLMAKAKTKVKIAKEIFLINDAKMVYAKAGDTPQIIAKRTNTSLKRILTYNEELTLGNQQLATEEKVFLQKKRRNFRGKQRKHTVKEGETMYNIAQSYGLCLGKLYKKNKMNRGTQPATGEQISIRGKARRRPLLKKENPMTPPSPVLIEEATPTKVESKKEETPIIELEEEETIEPIIFEEEKEPETPTQKETEFEKEIIPVTTNPVEKQAVYHIVLKGETLWRISQNYGTTVEVIQQLNDLKTKIILVGQRLRVE